MDDLGEAPRDDLWYEQQLRWRDQLGTEYTIPEMTTSHLKNSMRYLLRNAQRVHDERTVSSFMRVEADPHLFDNMGEQAAEAMKDYMFEHLRYKPKEWIRSQPIMKAFHHELQRRRRRVHLLKDEGVAVFEFPS